MNLQDQQIDTEDKKLADYVFRGTTQSLCPTCLAVVPAKIIVRGERVYFRKRCETCGPREDFVCSDVAYYDRLDFSVPSKIPKQHGVEPNKGCPYDCGLCTEHEQHTCIALVELTSNCNLKCPMCFASSGPGGQNLTFEQCKASIDRIVEVEGRAEVIQLSGGEPTIHPEFGRIYEYAIGQNVDYVQINSNGIRFANDPGLVELVSRHRKRTDIFFQFDGLDPQATRRLRGEDILQTKLRAIEKLGEADVHITLAVTLQGGVNDNEIGPIVDFALERPWITGINFQPATYSGRHQLPEELEERITFPDVMKAVQQQSECGFSVDDFFPLPCAHPNCHIIGLAYRRGSDLTPVNRFIDVTDNLDLLANGISFTRERSADLIAHLIGNACCSDGSCAPDGNSLIQLTANGKKSISENGTAAKNGDKRSNDNEWRSASVNLESVSEEFFHKAATDQLGAKDLFRITITSFLDAYNFDLRRLMKCCTHHVLPSGHVIPFCAYNVLYREGHAALPPINQAIEMANSTTDQKPGESN